MSEHVRIRTTPNKNVVLLMRKLFNFVQKLAPMIEINIAKQQRINYRQVNCRTIHYKKRIFCNFACNTIGRYK